MSWLDAKKTISKLFQPSSTSDRNNFISAHGLTGRTKMVDIRHDSLPQMYQDAFVAGALPRTPLEKLTAFPRHPSWTCRSLVDGEKKGRISKGATVATPAWARGA